MTPAKHSLFNAQHFPAWADSATPLMHGWTVWQNELTAFLKPFPQPVVFEVGSWLGKTAHMLLSSFPTLKLYCLDKWGADNGVVHERLTTSYETWCANLKPFKERVCPVRCSSERGLCELRALNIKPDLIYIDGAHDFTQVLIDVHAAYALFPKAIICGDDYTHNGKNARMRVGEALDEFTKQTDVPVRATGRFWRLVK